MRITKLLLALASLLLATPAARARTVIFEEEVGAAGRPRTANGLLFSPDGRYLLVLGSQHSELYEAPGFRSVGRFEVPEIHPSRASFSPDGKLVAVAAMHDFAAVAVPAGTVIGKGDMGHDGVKFQVVGVGFAPDGRSLVAVSAKRYAVFKVEQSGLTRVHETELPGDLRGLAYADFTPDGRYLLMPRQDAIQFFDIAEPLSPRLRTTIRLSGMGQALRPDGKQMIVRADGKAVVLNPGTGGEIYTWPLLGCCVTTFAYGDKGSRLALTDTEKNGLVTVVVDSRNGRELARVTGRAGAPVLTFSRDGRYVAAREGGELPNGHVHSAVWVEEWDKLAKAGPPVTNAVRWNEADGTVEGIAARARREAEAKAVIAAELARSAEESDRAAVEADARSRKLDAETARRRARAATAFRAQMKVGDESNCGLVVEVKRPIVKIQTQVGELWIKIDRMYPAGLAGCRIVNGVYQEP